MFPRRGRVPVEDFCKLCIMNGFRGTGLAFELQPVPMARDGGPQLRHLVTESSWDSIE